MPSVIAVLNVGTAPVRLVAGICWDCFSVCTPLRAGDVTADEAQPLDHLLLVVPSDPRGDGSLQRRR